MEKDALSFYLQYSPSTDPGQFEELYRGLPDSPKEICRLINATLIHPSKMSQFEQLPQSEREDGSYVHIEGILEELLKRNSAGLTESRTPEQRMILACGHFARFLVSIMRHKGCPARIRVGFVPYLSGPGGNKHIDHWICEIWNDKTKTWILVDPDLQMIDFERNRFEFAYQAWKKARKKQINPEDYGYGDWWGMNYIKGNLCHDLFACTNDELIYWQGPEIFHRSVDELTQPELELLDHLAELLSEAEANLDELLVLKGERTEFQHVR